MLVLAITTVLRESTPVEVIICVAEEQHVHRILLSHSSIISDLEVIRISIPVRNKKETCNRKQPWGSNSSQFTDNTGSSNTKCKLSALNNDVTVKISTLQDVRQRKRFRQRWSKRLQRQRFR